MHPSGTKRTQPRRVHGYPWFDWGTDIAGTRSRRRKRGSGFWTTAREPGRISKTEFVLVRRGLLKVEQLHALARDVFNARRGRIDRREQLLKHLSPQLSLQQLRKNRVLFHRCGYNPCMQGIRVANRSYSIGVAWSC